MTPAAVAPVEDFLQQLGRAVRQFHTYPETSSRCADAVTACCDALNTLDHHERVSCRVAPDGLIVDDTHISGPIVAHELARRLHAARVAAIDFDLHAMPRHVSRFCARLVQCDGLARTTTTLAELLADDGVDTIVPAMAPRPEVLDVGAPAAPLCDLVAHEQQRRQTWFAQGVPASYLYPPDKGWVRLDPGTGLDHIALVDLAVLVNDPSAVATMLLRLTDDDAAGAGEGTTALEQKFSDVATLFTSLDPRLARVMFGKLAKAVLELEPARRADLLRRTILPGLLDGRADGSVLRDFPDVDLVDSLFLLLDLEAAAPEVLTAALQRLDLPSERRDAVVPLLNARLHEPAPEQPGTSRQRDIDRLAGGLIRVDAAAGKDFSEFAAFDLSIDDQASAAIASAHDAIGGADVPVERLRLLANLIRLQPNPAVAEVFLRQVTALFGQLDRSARWTELASSAAAYCGLATTLRSSRPDVATVITNALETFHIPERVAALADLHDRQTGDRVIAKALVEAFGVTLVPGILATLDDPAWHSKAPAVIALMCDHARLVAPALARRVPSVSASTARAVVKALGFAGDGYESVIEAQLEHQDEQTAREALRALARIGSTQAAALVAGHLQGARVDRRVAAEEALWRFPEAHARAQVRQLLGRRDFVVGHPDVASRLLTRAANGGAGTDGLHEVLAEIESLRFRFWNPGLVRIALKARELRAR